MAVPVYESRAPHPGTSARAREVGLGPCRWRSAGDAFGGAIRRGARS